MQPPLSLPLAPPGDAPSAFVIFNLKTQKFKLNKPRRQSLPSLVERSSAFLRCSLPPTLLPCVFGCSPSWRGLPPDRASEEITDVQLSAPQVVHVVENPQFVCAAVRDAPFAILQVPTILKSTAGAVLRERGTHASNTSNTPRSGKHRLVSPKDRAVTASQRFLARSRPTGARWRRARRDDAFSEPACAGVRANDRLERTRGVLGASNGAHRGVFLPLLVPGLAEVYVDHGMSRDGWAPSTRRKKHQTP